MSIRSSRGKLAGALAGAFAAFAGYGGLNIDPGANAEAWMIGNEEVIRFTQSGQLTVIGSGTVELLIVGGGGGGGRWNAWPGDYGGGGGGAGGVIHKESFAVAAGTYDVVVGAGGTGGGFNATKITGCAGNGGDSSVFGCTGSVRRWHLRKRVA